MPHTTHIRRPLDVISAIMSGLTFGMLIFASKAWRTEYRGGVATELILAVVLGTTG